MRVLSGTLAAVASGCLICIMMISAIAGAEDSEGPAPSLEETISAGDVIASIRSGEAVDIEGVRVVGDIDLSDRASQINKPVRMENCTFEGRVGFEGVTFGEVLDLKGSTFKGEVSFQNARVLADAGFAGARFEDGADFRLAEFERSAQFGRATFDYVAFNNTQFQGNVDFSETNFTKGADFDLVQFARAASFMKAEFMGETRFTNARFGGTTIFMNSDFRGDTWFDGARFDSDVLFRSSRFHKGAVFFLANFGGFSDFSGVNFDRGAVFALTKFSDNAYFTGAHIEGNLILESARIYTMQLEGVTFGNKSQILLKDADFSKFIVRWDTIKDRINYDGAAYLALVKNYKDLEWFDDADNCYYQYRKIGQEMEPWGWGKIIDIISLVSCGYGVRVSYTIFWSIFTIIFFGLVFWAGHGMRKYDFEMLGVSGNLDGGSQERKGTLVDALYFSTAMFTTSQAPVNTYPVGYHRHLAMIEGIMGWFLLGLFVVVLSGMLIR